MTDLRNPLIAARIERANRVLLDAPGGVELEVKISDNQGVRSFAFAYDGVPLPAARRRFIVHPGESKILKWIMIGPGGSSMVVQVLNGDTVVVERTPSRIPDGYTSSFDLLEVAV